MVSPDPVGAAGARSREMILEAAIAMIEENGEAAVRVDEVARTTGIAKSSLYHYFGSRDGLVAVAQATRYNRSLIVGMDTLRDRIPTYSAPVELRDDLRAWFAATIGDDAGGPHRRAVRLDVLGSSVSRPGLQDEIVRANDEAAAVLADVIGMARDRGLVVLPPHVTPFDVAYWFHGLWNGRYLVEISRSADLTAGWDRVAQFALESVLFGNVCD